MVGAKLGSLLLLLAILGYASPQSCTDSSPNCPKHVRKCFLKRVQDTCKLTCKKCNETDNGGGDGNVSDCTDSSPNCPQNVRKCFLKRVQDTCKFTCKTCNKTAVGKWSGWSEWICTAKCGIGMQSRFRKCIGSGCQGEKFQIERCDRPPCELETEWSICSKTCGEGTRRRYRCGSKDCKWRFERCNAGTCASQTCPPNFQHRYKSNHECCDEAPNPSGYDCGSPTTLQRIIGGVDAQAQQWPWLVIFQIRIGNDVFSCGGSIISPTFVLTAAHCIPINVVTNMTIYSGVLKYSERELGLKVGVKRVFIHPDYNQDYSDVALIELSSSLSYSDTIKPICLPMGEETPIDSTCHVAGWGISDLSDPSTTDDQQETSVLNFDTRACIDGWGNLPGSESIVTFLRNYQGYLCVGNFNRIAGPCKGDSGGALACQRCKSCKWYVAGVVSIGPATCARVDVPAVYTKVTYFESWILNITGLQKYELSCDK